MLAVLLGGCKAGPVVPTKNWKVDSNCLYFLAFQALGQGVPAVPQPALAPGKSSLADVQAYLKVFPGHPKTLAEGDTADGGYHYLEVEFQEGLRSVYYLAKQGGFQDKLVYFSCLVKVDGSTDPLDKATKDLFGTPRSQDPLFVENEEGRQSTDVQVKVWDTPLGVLTERGAYNDEEDESVGVLELWVPQAYGEQRPKL